MSWKYLWLFISCAAGIVNVLCLGSVSRGHILLGVVGLLTAEAAFGVWVQEQITSPVLPCSHDWQVAYQAPKKRKARKKRKV